MYGLFQEFIVAAKQQQGPLKKFFLVFKN